SASHKQCFTQILQSCSLPGFDFADDGWTTTCIVITVLGRSPKGALHCAIFLSFSRILPPLISFTSLALFGTIVLSLGQSATTRSLSAATVVAAALQRMGPMSEPSKSRNFTSTSSSSAPAPASALSSSLVPSTLVSS
uniref:Uncharacterized protein n=1 Tax=Aegilops tauschii subsp. strangulata TaxID=200361 RepID=A0A453BVI5_AEGTS